ncbi:hypothetical protein [Actinokineospora cianjurensis]|uniref:Uncharacterized protein n=1 Tax=Actinokineospora cianjurensis TaxID=585224 RepID=A0A421B2F4_9PSEU|nr:hypothetical protein [Actinokineospora cianjurensis]RLK58453.1 hypothetical protein CLV68_4558 [Actinokineospora cianjurensis]
MARHLAIATAHPHLLTSAFETLRGLVNCAADRLSYWRFRHTASFSCEHCGITRVPPANTGAELRRARELATDHSRHGFHAGAPTVYGA